MSAIDDILESACETVIYGSTGGGDTVTFRGSSVVASINHKRDKKVNEQTNSPEGIEVDVYIKVSTVEALSNPNKPERGEFFEDADGQRYSITRSGAERIGPDYVCKCFKFIPGT